MATKTPRKEPMKQAETYIYVGPTLPKGTLRENMALQGSRESICKMFADEIKEIPQIKNLIVPTGNLGAFLPKLRTAGNLAYQHYQDVKSLISAKRRDGNNGI